MIANVKWQGSMLFEGSSDGHKISMDAKPPIGKNGGLTPKELVALGIGGCTAMDVIALLNKYKQLPTSFDVSIDLTSSQGKQPAVFTNAALLYSVVGEVEAGKLLEAVKLSQTKYCSVSAMLSKAFPISYRVELNGNEVGTGEAAFL